MEPLIRAAQLPDEADQVAVLYREVAAWHSDRWPSDYLAPSAEPSLPDELRKPMPDNACLLVAEVESAGLVGLVSGTVHPRPTYGLHKYDGPLLYVGDLVVTEAYRGRGIGTRLMRALEGWGAERGATAITLYVDDRNQAASKLYEGTGFRRISVLMRKDLR